MFDPDSFDIQSAGSDPAGYVHDNAITTMNNIGIDISQAKSKSIEELEDNFLENICWWACHGTTGKKAIAGNLCIISYCFRYFMFCT